MKETYRSKMSPWLVVPSGVLITGLLVLMWVQGAWPGVLIVGLVLAFIVHMFATTYYTIEDNVLQVNCGFLIHTKIDINTITRIVPTNTILSSPALSFDRIEVFYNRYDSVIISPGDKAAFVARLREVNAGINWVETPV